jgi:hypothetical protein
MRIRFFVRNLTVGDQVDHGPRGGSRNLGGTDEGWLMLRKGVKAAAPTCRGRIRGARIEQASLSSAG